MPRSVWLGPLPHIHVMLLAPSWPSTTPTRTRTSSAPDSTVALLTALQSVPVVLALSRPAPPGGCRPSPCP
ncbi:hypothetical protein [Streptomyces thioluteus]|uniref:hypothetical protein n=1 Tax=Streptomyces thioluteus TaxID=66431 RepID=UPI0031EA9FD9